MSEIFEKQREILQSIDTDDLYLKWLDLRKKFFDGKLRKCKFAWRDDPDNYDKNGPYYPCNCCWKRVPRKDAVPWLEQGSSWGHILVVPTCKSCVEKQDRTCHECKDGAYKVGNLYKCRKCGEPTCVNCIYKGVCGKCAVKNAKNVKQLVEGIMNRKDRKHQTYGYYMDDQIPDAIAKAIKLRKF